MRRIPGADARKRDGHITAVSLAARVGPADPGSGGMLAIADAEQVVALVHDGQTVPVAALVRTLASANPQRLVGLVIALAAAVPAQDIEELLGWVEVCAP